MRILLLYDNFIRDFRGLLLLKHLLVAKGHKVWIRASWNKPLHFTKLKNIDVLVGGQIAEVSTHHIGKFAKENNIRFVLNSTENVTVPSKFDLFITYNTSELNAEIIDLQSIAAIDVYEFIMSHPGIKPENKKKYKFIGFPRIDLTVNETFRKVEGESFRKKYNLPDSGKVYLFISSFLLDGAYDGVPQQDLDRWSFTELKKMTNHLLYLTSDILKRLINEELQDNDVLLIKKHPWDCSSYFRDNFQSKRCVVLDNNDYILPCLDNADFVLHTYSTAAIEAWILNKRTISILPQVYKDSYTLNHMRNELSVSTFEELKLLIHNYPQQNPSIKSLEIFSPNLDGLATVRLADEIDRLKPHPAKTEFKLPLTQRVKTEIKELLYISKPPLNSKIKTMVWDWLLDNGLIRLNPDKHADRNTKLHDFISWENSRADVIKKYSKHFKKYVSEVAHYVNQHRN